MTVAEIPVNELTTVHTDANYAAVIIPWQSETLQWERVKYFTENIKT